MDAVGARFTVYMGEDRIIAYPDEYVASRERHPMQFLTGLIRDRGLGGAHIGVARFHDAFLLVNWCRLNKSSKELQYMKEAGRIGVRVLIHLRPWWIK